MSMSGDSLADWQTIVKALNERIQAMGSFGWSITGLIPVPTSKNHITSAFVSQVANCVQLMFGEGWANPFWCDPDRPLVITQPGDPGWSGSYQTGNYIYGPTRWVPFQVYPYQYIGDIDTRSIYKTIPNFYSIPLRGAELAKIGDFLDWCNNSLELLTKTALNVSYINTSGASGNFRWEQSTGEIYEVNQFELIGTASTFTDFYTFALAHLTDNTSTGLPYCQCQVVNDGMYIWLTLNYSGGKVLYGSGSSTDLHTTPGGIHANITLYYSSFGDNCGYPVNSNSTHIDYSTEIYQNVGPENTINIGFDISSISTVPTMPTSGNSYTKEESLGNLFAVWDFENYFQDCV